MEKYKFRFIPRTVEGFWNGELWVISDPNKQFPEEPVEITSTELKTILKPDGTRSQRALDESLETPKRVKEEEVTDDKVLPESEGPETQE